MNYRGILAFLEIKSENSAGRMNVPIVAVTRSEIFPELKLGE